MTALGEIESWAKQVGDAFHPDRIILFGSFAAGTATDNSDVDILVICSHSGKNWMAATQIRRRVEPPFPLDLLVRSPEQIRTRLSLGDPFFRTVIDQGQVLYENADG